MIDQAARARLETWKQSLLDLTTDNPLIDAKDGPTCVALAVDPQQLAAALANGGGLSLVGLPSNGAPEAIGAAPTRPVAQPATVVADEGWSFAPVTEQPVAPVVGDAATAPAVFNGNRLDVVLSEIELPGRLRAMEREHRRGKLDRGEHLLWVGLGMLTWTDVGGAHRAPLVLWPVEIERVTGGTPRLLSAVEPGLEPQINATLAEKLRRDFEIVVGIDLASEIAAALAAADGIAVTRPGWRVERAAVLGCFAPQRFASWHDLDDREIEHLPALVMQLANPASAFAQPTPAAAAAVTARPGFMIPGTGASEWATDLLAPLDADATQLQVVSAAGAGASFVVQAAPGTGATQTIANLIAHCVGLGKSVLFASPQRGALDAVQQRLASIGLGDLCLPLGSRTQVIAQLDRVLSRAFRPAGGPSLLDGARLAELRQVLDGHAASLHRVGAFGRSLHDVLGRLVELRTEPRAALADNDAVGLNAAVFDVRKAAVEQLALVAAKVEPVASHPWRASTLDKRTFGSVHQGRGRALAAIEETAAAGAALGAAMREVASLVPGLVARTRDQLQAVGALAALAAASPRPGAELLTPLASRSPRSASDALDEQIALLRARGGGKALEIPREPLGFLLLAKRQRALAAEVRDVFTDAVDGIDPSALWSQLRPWSGSLAPVRYMALRNPRAEIKAAAVPLQLETDSSMLAGLEAVIAERACRVALLAAAEPAKRWFGELTRDPLELDIDAVENAVKWGVDLRRAFDALEIAGNEKDREVAWRALVAQVAASTNRDTDEAGLAAFRRLADAVTRWLPALVDLGEATGIDLRAENAPDHLAMLAERTATLRHAVDELAAWVAFHDARHAALAAGVGPAVAAIERGDLAASDLALAWERATLLAWADAELAESQVAMYGGAHHAHVAAFADLDRAALALVRSRALVRFAERVPAAAPGKLDPDSELARFKAALRTAQPLRELLAIAPALVPKVAPCIAATPLAAALHLDPALRFDVVVIEHANQLATADVIGLVARGEATVIVGDSQLPAVTDDALAAARASRLPELRLATHYRSRHADVVAFANERYYEDRLHVFPTMQSSPDLGVVWRRGDVTPETVAAEVIGRLRDPNQRGRSLGVIAFSRAEADRIEDLLDAARAAEPALELAADEPLVVRDIDAAASLVRDVIVLAADDALAIRETRRLALAITRAREQLIVMASPHEVTADAPVVARDLAALLAFATRDPSGIETDAPASPITEAIARALAERGWIVRHQVGAGAYRVDLAVVDPSCPDRYVLAIECDGPMYAKATATRDRDRLRGEILTQLGWRLHRIWSLDWWSDSEREIQRAHGAIVTAIAATRRRAPAVVKPVAPRMPRASRPPAERKITPVAMRVEISAPVEAIDAATLPTLAAGSSPVKISRNAIPIGPYIAAAIPPGRRTPDDLFAPRHLPELGKVIEQVLAAEAPIHLDLLARRVGAYFGVGRVTQRVTDQIRSALLGRCKLVDEEGIVWRRDQDPTAVPAVRVAGSSPTGRREIGEIPLSELASAARIVVERAAGIATTDLVRDAARLIGFARITQQISDRVAQGVRLAQIREMIAIDAGRAKLPE